MDSLLYRRKLNKIFKKINKISSLGKDNILEWYKYIDEIIRNGDYSVLEDVIYINYGLELTKFDTVESWREIVWDRVCMVTNSTILKRISDMYRKMGVYQQSNFIFKLDSEEVDSSNRLIPIGEINEVEMVSENFKFYLKNKMYSRLIGENIIKLVITKNGIKYEMPGEGFEITWNSNNTYDNNVFSLYKEAILFLLDTGLPESED
jgi:hypothetical protein